MLCNDADQKILLSFLASLPACQEQCSNYAPPGSLGYEMRKFES